MITVFNSASRLFRLVLVAVAAAVVASCTAPGRIASDGGASFERTGRFSVSVQESTGAQDGVQGGFAWLDTGALLQLDLSNPLGSTLARVTVDKGMAMLERSNGAREYARDPDALVEKVLGSPVPVAGLRDWLQGETGKVDSDDVETDDQGRPVQFVQQGWRVKLSRYDALGPTLLQLNRNDARRSISVRLAISSQPAPASSGATRQ